jgi:hypothetical protein
MILERDDLQPGPGLAMKLQTMFERLRRCSQQPQVARLQLRYQPKIISGPSKSFHFTHLHLIGLFTDRM